MRIIFFIPALHAMSGGLANIYSVARNLKDLGREVALMGPFSEAAGFAGAAKEGFTILPWGAGLEAGDSWCIPESWPNAAAIGLNAGARVLVYVQNWVYMLNTLPQNLRWGQLPLEYLAVSRPVAWFMREVLGLKVGAVLPPAIDAAFFRAPARPADHVRVAFMPRKNRALITQIQQVALAWLAERPFSPRIEWVEVHKKSREESAELLASCQLFISAGFPEGFGLPPLEGMASGCVPVGFTGFGGWEYMRQSRLPGMEFAGTARPCFSLAAELEQGEGEQGYPLAGVHREEGPGNGFFFSDGDTLGAGLALAGAIRLAHEKSEAWQDLERNCRETAARYTLSRQRDVLAGIF